MNDIVAKRVAIIGAGLAGLGAIKSCLEEGLDPVCYELRSDLGGLWNYTDEVTKGRSSVMKSTVTNNSKETYCYSDFPVPDDFPVFMPHKKVLEYLRLYTDKFHLEKYIKFESRVVQILAASDFQITGRWLVSVQMKNAQTTTVCETFDAVCICAGHHSIPYSPKYEGEETFKGSLMHAQQYRDQKGFEGKRVVVVGIGNSAADIACELSRVGSQVFLSSRRGSWFTPRLAPDGSPVETFYVRRFLSVLLAVLPSCLSNLLMVGFYSIGRNHELLGLESNHHILSQQFLISDELPSCLVSGKVQLKGEIKKLTDDSVMFKDGSVENIDAVICATGYEVGFPFVKNSAFEGKEVPHNLYKLVFPPGISPPTIAAIGYSELQGSTLAAAELHSRWAVRVFKGKVKLPSQDEMLKHISMRKKIVIHSEAGNHVLPWSVHLDDVAEEIGCLPNFFSLLQSDPWLALNFFFGPLLPAHYRLVGPGAWSGARHNILTVKERIAAPLRSGKVVHGNWRTVRFMLFTFMIIFIISIWIIF